MTGLNCNCKTQDNVNETTLDAQSNIADSNPAIEPIELFLDLRRSVDTLNSLLKYIPSDDDIQPILALIADDLNRTFLATLPVFSSSSANSWGPAGGPPSQHGLERVPN